MSDLLRMYVAGKTTTGAVKATESTANGMIVLVGIGIGILFLMISPYLYLLLKSTIGHDAVPLKKLNEYGFDTFKIKKIRLASYLLIIISFVLLVVLSKIYAPRIGGIGVILSIIGVLFVPNLIIALFMRYSIAGNEIKNKNNFLKFLDEYDELLTTPKSVIVQAAATHTRDSKEYTKVLDIEVDRLMSNVKEKYSFSDTTLSILEADSKKILDS